MLGSTCLVSARSEIGVVVSALPSAELSVGSVSGVLLRTLTRSTMSIPDGSPAAIDDVTCMESCEPAGSTREPALGDPAVGLAVRS